MLTRYFISLALAISIVACSGTLVNNSVAAQSGAQPQLLNFKLSSKQHYSVAIERDATVPESATPKKIKIVGVIKGIAIVLIDTYRSIPGGMSYCQAGSESFLRIVSIASKKPVETFHVKLESCRDNIELASPGIEWMPTSSEVVIHWLLGPGTSGKAETRTLKIDQQGHVKSLD